jgi:prepilin-type N-terminal cleavage/methylation domain-containing protein
MAEQRSTDGFTLIELSIVLVIIGLLIGGVLSGRDLIEAAEIRKVVSQRDQFDAAAATFTLKFNCLPGDCANARDLGVGTPGGYGQNGNGDGTIAAYIDVSDDWQYEAVNSWYHLSKAGLTSWSFDPAFASNYPDANGRTCSDSNGVRKSPCLAMTAPVNDAGNAGWWIWAAADPSWDATVLDLGAGHYWWIGVSMAPVESGAAPLLPAEAYAIDAKIDDGLPLAGKVRASGDNTTDGNDGVGHPTPPSIRNSDDVGDTNACVDALITPPRYNVVNRHREDDNRCALVIKWLL